VVDLLVLVLVQRVSVKVVINGKASKAKARRLVVGRQRVGELVIEESSQFLKTARLSGQSESDYLLGQVNRKSTQWPVQQK
jgi:hypothetical protein